MNACVMATVAIAVWQKVLLFLYLIVTCFYIHRYYYYCGVLVISSLRHGSRGYFDVTAPEHACFYVSVNQPQPRPSCSKLS